MLQPVNPYLYVGRSLHVGLNFVDPKFYDGWNGRLYGCVNDALMMLSIAKNLGYRSRVLLNQDATLDNFTEAVLKDAAKLEKSDVYMLSYSGHGGNVPDVSGDEEDKLDETLCLYDGQMIDDYLFWLLCHFPERARVIVISDSCHSGTVVRGPAEQRPKGMPSLVVQGAYLAKKNYYDESPRTGRNKYSELKCSVCLLSGCQDNQTSLDGSKNGLFTETMLSVWDDGKFQGDYWNFHKQILRKMPAEQSPNLLFVGFPNLHFEWSKPFHIR